jgi:hypothetical protein
MPVAGVATRAVGTAGATAAATVRVVRAGLAALAVNACAVVTALDWVTVVDGCATVASAFTTPEVAGVVDAVDGDDGVVALTAAECVEFDSGSAGVDAACSVSGAGVAGGVLA